MHGSLETRIRACVGCLASVRTRNDPLDKSETDARIFARLVNNSLIYHRFLHGATWNASLFSFPLFAFPCRFIFCQVYSVKFIRAEGFSCTCIHLLSRLLLCWICTSRGCFARHFLRCECAPRCACAMPSFIVARGLAAPCASSVA